MAASNRQTGTGKTPPGWLHANDVADRLGVKAATFRSRLRRRVPNHARRTIAGRLSFDPRFMPGVTLDLVNANRDAGHTPADPSQWRQADIERDSTVRRILEEADAFAADLAADGFKGGLGQADAIFCRQRGEGYYPLGFRSLKRWRRDRKTGRPFNERRGRKRGGDNGGIGPQAWEFFVATALKLKLPLTEAYRITQGKSLDTAGAYNWRWSISLSAVRLRFQREFPEFYRDYVCLDPEKWAQKHLPKLDRRQSELPANQVWEIDGTPANVMCSHNGRAMRPQVVIVGCPSSRMILGVAVGLSESTELIRRALLDAYKGYGAPKLARMDQGKAFTSQGIGDVKRRKAAADLAEVVGFFKLLGCELHVAQGRMPHQKGFIESMMRGVDRHDRLYGPRKFYVGNRPANRSRLADKWIKKNPHKLPTIADYEATLRDYWYAENRRPRPDMEGQSPLQRFNATAIPKRVVPAHAEEFLRRRPQRVKVGTKGVVVTIGGVRLHYGHRDPRVWERQGQALVAYIDESDTSNVLLCEPEGRPLFYAANDGLIGTDAESIREAGKAQRKARKRARERFADIDLAAAPTVNVALELKRKAAEHAAAKADTGEISERGTTVIYTGFEQELKQAEQQELRVAVGAEDMSPTEDLSLDDLTANMGNDGMDAVAPLGFDDVGGSAMEGSDDPMQYLK